MLLATTHWAMASDFANAIVGSNVMFHSVFRLPSVLPFLILGAVFLLQYRIKEARLETGEKLLEIELHVAELAEKLETKD